MQPSGHEMRSNLVSNNLMALTRRSNHDLVSGCRNSFLQTIPCPGADDATFAPEKSIYSCSDFYESNHLLSLSLPRFYDWFYFLGVHVSELIWTDWCIGQREGSIKITVLQLEILFSPYFQFQNVFNICSTGTRWPSSWTNSPWRSTKNLNLLDEFMSLNLEQNLTFMFLNPEPRLISMYLCLRSISVKHENLISLNPSKNWD